MSETPNCREDSFSLQSDREDGANEQPVTQGVAAVQATIEAPVSFVLEEFNHDGSCSC